MSLSPAGEASGKIVNDLSPAGRPAESGASGGSGAGALPGHPEFVNEFIMICRRPGGRRKGAFVGQRPPTDNLNDFHNDFPPAGEAGGK